MRGKVTPLFTDSGHPESKLIRKRFVKDQDREKQHLYYAKLEERRSKMRATLEKERKSRREAQVRGLMHCTSRGSPNSSSHVYTVNVLTRMVYKS